MLRPILLTSLLLMGILHSEKTAGFPITRLVHFVNNVPHYG